MVDIYYMIYRRLDISSYILNLLYKDTFFYDKIEKVSNKKPQYKKDCLWVNKTIYIYWFEGNF